MDIVLFKNLFVFWECFFFPWDLLFLKGYLCCICLVLLLSWKTSLCSTELIKIFTSLLINLVWIGRGILIIGIGDKKGYLDDQFKQLQKLLQNENNSDCGWFSILFDDFEKLSNNISRALWVFVIYVVDFGKKICLMIYFLLMGKMK